MGCQLFGSELINIMSKEQVFDQKEIFEIRIAGTLDQVWSDWFGNFQMTYQENETVLIGAVLDQAALFGLLTKLNNLGLHLISLKRIE